MRSCLAVTTLKLLTVLGVVVTINKVVLPRINKAIHIRMSKADHMALMVLVNIKGYNCNIAL